MNHVKCECGHVNPHGTVLCESCGKILVETEEKKKLVDMRYEGSARRSQTYKKTIVDRIWNFFSSVKVGIWLIVVTLSVSAIGTILPQEEFIPQNVPAGNYYESEYGWFGRLYYLLGFQDLYGSWIYLLLIASIGVSLVICSLDRVVPLYRALKRQRVIKHEGFMKRQRLYIMAEGEAAKLEETFENIKQNLQKKRYHIRDEDGSLLAEKGRFSRWGPYINHIGLIIFLIGCMLRFVPGMYVDEQLWVEEGEIRPIPGTNREYYLGNNEFIIDVYDGTERNGVFEESLERTNGDIVSNYQSNVTLYKRSSETVLGQTPELEKVKDYSIQVNKPLKFDGYSLYQMSFNQGEFKAMTFTLINQETGESYGEIKIDLEDPQEVYDLGNGYKVAIVRYYPDVKFDENLIPTNTSPYPRNPAFIFNVISPENQQGEMSIVAIQQTYDPSGQNKYKMKFAMMESKEVSGLTVRKDNTIWILALGGLIFMIGVVQGAYWNHRRIWIQKQKDHVLIAAHTNKNWYGLKRELEKVFEETPQFIPEDQMEKNEGSE
ncbi:cytochrome c biogenesis protein ResB [Bacillus oleivorans]|nr:cytochrome c biogenesis protein ResB [Bacillus oleivorans]